MFYILSTSLLIIKRTKNLTYGEEKKEIASHLALCVNDSESRTRLFWGTEEL